MSSSRRVPSTGAQPSTWRRSATYSVRVRWSRSTSRSCPGRPEHPRITYLTGSSTDPAVVAQVDERIAPGDSVLVVLDSDHSRDHVLDELDTWSPRVSVDSYLIVEDTNINGHPIRSHGGPGPWEAVEQWLPANPGFRLDESREKFLLTFNPRGFIRRIE